MSEPSSIGDKVERPFVLVCGVPRSGTTLLAEQISANFGVGIGRETHFFPLVGSGVHRHVVLRRRKGLASILAGLQRGDAGQIEPAEVERVAAELDAGEYTSVTEVFLATVRALGPPAELYGEKTPRHLEHLPRVLREVRTTRAVIALRDPRAVYASLLRVPWSSPDLRLFAARWNAYARMSRRMVRRYSDRVVEVRYEDLVEDSGRVVGELGGILGLGRVGQDCARPPGRATFDAQREPWKVGSDGAIRPDSLDRWKSELTATEAEEIVRLCGTEADRHGYSMGSCAGSLLGATSITRAGCRFEASLIFRRSLVR